ncbi:MAG TPA: UPF0158 family protein [Polyangiaceae bacterium]|nr:UPF0158 family protein [Polyangiaceae bacterium]
MDEHRVDAAAGDAATGALRQVPVDWEALEDAFENNAPEVHSYLHFNTGEVLRVVDGVADPDMHSRIAANNGYIRVEPVSSREQYRWMERFIQMVEDEDLKGKLTGAIDGKGAFRRFKDVLMSYSVERERWFVFRSERLRVFMEAWLAAHQVAPIPRPEVTTPPQGEEQVAPITQAQVQPRRTRTAEWLRRQVQEVAEALSARDLEKVLAFAEFVRARRVARGFSPRAEGAHGADDAEDRVAEPRSEGRQDESPPSSRKLAAGSS